MTEKQKNQPVAEPAAAPGCDGGATGHPHYAGALLRGRIIMKPVPKRHMTECRLLTVREADWILKALTAARDELARWDGFYVDDDGTFSQRFWINTNAASKKVNGAIAILRGKTTGGPNEY
jgi:hypothetical protein